MSQQATEQIISQFSANKDNTGSSDVQIALFTMHVKNLTEHMKTHKKDYQARRGLLSFVTKRKRLLVYFKKKNHDGYRELIKRLKLKSV